MNDIGRLRNKLGLYFRDSKIEIAGLDKDVAEAYTYASSLLEKYNKARMCGDILTWKYEDPTSNTWKPLSLMDNYDVHKLEKVNCVWTNITIFSLCFGSFEICVLNKVSGITK